MSNQSTSSRPQFGAKWLREASYLTEADRKKVFAVVAEARRAYPESGVKIGVRPPAYIGEPHPFAMVVLRERGGERNYRAVYR
jgi:hypothetical protein